MTDAHDPDASGDASPGVDQLQQAALDAVAAVRALLDAAESVIRDPDAIQAVTGTIVDVANSAVEVMGDAVRRTAQGAASYGPFRSGPADSAEPDGEDADAAEPRPSTDGGYHGIEVR